MFDFISNHTYKNILLRDYEELEKCMNAGASKSAVVMSGSIIESIFTEHFISNPPEGKTKEQILRLKLYQIINLAEETGLISKKIKDLSSVIRDYRNYIHPAKEVRMDEFIDKETANVAYSLLKMVIKEVNTQYSKQNHSTAEKLFNKLLSDNSAYSIFDKLVNRTSKVELEKLTDLITEHYTVFNANDTDTRRFTVKYLDILKSRLDDSFIKTQLSKLKEEVEHGDKNTALMLFDLFGERLSLLEEDVTDIIIQYIYSAIGLCTKYGDDEIFTLRYSNIADNLKLYNDKTENKEKYLAIIISIVKNLKDQNHGEHWYYIDIYKAMISDMNQESLTNYILKKVNEENYKAFQEIYDEQNELPF